MENGAAGAVPADPDHWRETETVDLQMRWLAGAVKEYPAGYNFAMLAFLETLWSAAELVIAAQRPPEAWANILRAPRPELTVLLKTPERASELAAVAPYTEEYPISSRWTAWRSWRRF